MKYVGRVAVLLIIPIALMAQLQGDNCSNAFVIETLDTAVTYTGSTENYTNDISSINCGVNLTAEGPDVIYKYYRPSGDTSCVTLYVTIPQDTWDVVLYVFKGDCDNPICIAGSDQFGPGSPEAFFFEIEPGVTHYITIDGETSNDYGPYVMSISACPTDIEEKEEISAIQDIRVFPTLSKGDITIQFETAPSNPVEISLYNVTGRKLMTLFDGLAENSMEFYLPDRLPEGVYMLHIESRNLSFTKEVIIAR